MSATDNLQQNRMTIDRQKRLQAVQGFFRMLERGDRFWVHIRDSAMVALDDLKLHLLQHVFDGRCCTTSVLRAS